MTLLTICRSAAQAAGFAAPGTIIGSSDTTANLLLSLANKSGKQLATKPWQILQKEHAFSTVASQDSYALPTDYGWYENNTAWDRTNYWAMRGSLTPSDWQRYKSGTMTTTPRTRFRVKAGQLYLDPTPTDVRSIVIEYVSNAWATDGVTTFAAFAADSNTSVLSEDLLELELTWRFLERKGFAYQEAKFESQSQIELALAHDLPRGPINLATDAYEIFPPLPTVPSTGYS